MSLHDCGGRIQILRNLLGIGPTAVKEGLKLVAAKKQHLETYKKHTRPEGKEHVQLPKVIGHSITIVQLKHLVLAKPCNITNDTKHRHQFFQGAMMVMVKFSNHV